MMGKKHKVTMELLTNLTNDLNNPVYEINVIDTYKLLLLGDIATSLAIIADNLNNDENGD